ncbi:MAG: CTP synthase [Alphaproteobacteria bacterium MarineAlpha5_Bin12]|nr:MAG: CTP synthase [Alphaproteobacteria bacterium MarineAlpha5_Bin12]|tara:strand:- start:43418 stop:45052 length:1635 start_codon:yes stop_codon:yes gene_type:complete
MHFIFITGGVTSSLGKGLSTASLGLLLQLKGYKVRLRKLDPYLNVDPGTMSPYQHGEVYVTEDGAETDLDLGHYERFTNVIAKKTDSISAGGIYSNVLKRERQGKYLGSTIQVIPHVTDEIKKFIKSDLKNEDFVLCEIGGTVGDIESLPFLESIRQLRNEKSKNLYSIIHVTHVPWLEVAGELKTKPTQHSVKQLQSVGIQPDFLLCRSDRLINLELKKKISLFCNVEVNRIINAIDAKSIYEVPILYHKEKLDEELLKFFEIKKNKKTINLDKWKKLNNTSKKLKTNVKIGIVGKYINLEDSYKSLVEALNHGGFANNVKVELIWIDSQKIEKEIDLKSLKKLNGILVPGGFGKRGIEGKIKSIKYSREKKLPFLGICLGMQMAIIEYGRNVIKLKNCNSTEFKKTENPVISLMTEWKKNGKIEKRSDKSNKGGTMRLGSYPCIIKKNSLAYKIYRNTKINERHRHRYEVNANYLNIYEKNNLSFSGMSPNKNLAEIFEYSNHPWFFGVQFHPELKSRPLDPHPIFVSFIKACLNNLKNEKN